MAVAELGTVSVGAPPFSTHPRDGSAIIVGQFNLALSRIRPPTLY